MKVIAILMMLVMTSVSAFAYDGYPTQGRIEGNTALFHEDDAKKKSNKSYPAWYRGNGKNGLADKDSLYSYKELLGPKAFVSEGHNNDYFSMGTLELAPGEAYPAHNHPSYEVYYILEGEAEWFVDDESQIVVPGDVIYHNPYAVHGWKNRSKDKPLKMAYVWWAAGDPSVLGKGARFTNPDLFKSKDKIKPYAIPLPKVRMSENDKPNAKTKYGEYPVPGRLVGTTAFLHQTAQPKKATKTHPEWIKGKRTDGFADNDSRYFYYELVGPAVKAPGFQNDHVYLGYMEWEPGMVYPAHNHIAPEFYYILSGEAEVYVNDEKIIAKKGSMIYNRSGDIHGWKVTSKEPFTMFWGWWAEEDPEVLNYSAKMSNMKSAQKEKTAKHYAVPLPKVEKAKKKK